MGDTGGGTDGAFRDGPADLGTDATARPDHEAGEPRPDEGQSDPGPEEPGADPGRGEIAPADFAIAITAPEQGSEATGAVWVEVDPVGQPYVLLDSLTVEVNGTAVFFDSKVPTGFVLDTAAWPDGELAIAAAASAGGGTASAAAGLTVLNPPFKFKSVHAEEPVYANDQEISVFVSTGKPGMELSADFAAIDSTFAPGAEDVFEIGGGKYMIAYTLAAQNTVADGEYQITITASDGVFTREYGLLSLGLQNQPVLPLRVGGAIFVPGALPETTPDWPQPIKKVSGNDYVITGGSAKVNVDFSDYTYPKEIIGIIVGAEGYSGYFQLPLSGSNGKEEALVLLRTFLEGETAPDDLTLQVAVRDARGRVSEYKTRKLEVKPVGSGDIQVSISWDTKTDVDLHVIEPNGCELYYGNTECWSGGWLDLDSNAACLLDNINNENVYWPEGQAPVGTYKVRVDFYEDCYSDGADWTVTIHACGTMDIYEGHFDPNTDDMGDAGSGVDVATFSNENCGRVVRGRVRYEDRTFDRYGFSASTWRPVRYALVEVRRAADHALLSKGFTDRWGNYEIQFANKEAPGIYVVVKSQTDYDDGVRKITVMNHPKFQSVYSVPSPEVDESTVELPVVNVDIPDVIGAGGFNILDVLTGGYDLVRLMTGKDLGALNTYWATGSDTTDTLYCSQFFYEHGVCSEKSALSVQGKDTDRDEFDDMVVLKEFFKFALEKVSLDNNPGGDAADGAWDDPARSWTEGVATFFACDVLAYPWFVNSRPGGVYLVQDYEQMTSPFSYGTQNATLSGPVSPYLVAAVLNDLSDGTAGEEPVDVVDGLRLGVYDAVFNYFPTFHFADRGIPGVDFVDFLDGWFCREWGDEISVTKMVIEDRAFPYDFNGPGLCIH